ncbi:MAG: glucoamylase family protein [Candidatus Limiplasma sp.]|nr:glucoamylase family protein [Candidatus Limiplasma sp.]
MQWIVSGLGLAILFLLARGVRRQPVVSYRDVLLEDELIAHIGALATRGDQRGQGRIRVPARMQQTILRSISLLNRYPQDELLPAASWLSDNGRFLQEMTASLELDLKAAPLLPKDNGGEVRIFRFAKELVGHSNGDIQVESLRKAVASWQQREPMTVNEVNCLPLALKAALLGILHEMIHLCTRQQQEFGAADLFAKDLRQKRETAAMRRFEAYKHSTTFLEHLLSILRTSEEPSAVAWLDKHIASLNHQTERLAQLEHDRQTENRLWVGNAITSLRVVSNLPWHKLCESMSQVHDELSRDPVYPLMDAESRSYYRSRVVRISRLTERKELAVCAAVLSLASSGGDPVESHVGYYLLDEGRPLLFEHLNARTLWARLHLFASTHALSLYRAACWLIFFGVMALGWLWGISPFLLLPLGIVFVYPFQQLTTRLCHRWVSPKMVPRLLVEQLAADQQTLVVCPTLLTDKEHALAMVKHLSVLHQANPDPRLHFLLLGDYQDSLTGTLGTDEDIVSTAAAAVRALGEDSGHPFLYMQRARVFNARDSVYMSRERKRGGLETLLRIIDGRPIEDTFTYCSCPRSALQGQYRYVITLDSDTVLPPGSALRMVGAMLHPLQQRREHQGAMRGISILQPRMEVATHTVGSYLSLFLGGPGGSDPYNALSSDLMQDCHGRGSFVGKGIIDPKGFLQGTDGMLIPGAILSHDLLEGELTGCAVATDITLYDGQPAALKGFLLRLNRWTRGDWQLLPYVFPYFPASARAPKARLDALGKHKIWQNLLRSLVAPAKIILIFYAVVLRMPLLLILTLLSTELVPLFPLSLASLGSMATRLLMLPCEAAMQGDAIARTLYRLFVSRRNLLQWTTAAQLSKPTAKPSMEFFYMNMGAGFALGGLSILLRPLFPLGIALGGLWSLFLIFLPAWEQPYRQPQYMTEYMREELKRLASSTWLFFDTVVTEQEHFLPPDNVQIEPNKGVSHRTSPTNIGLYLVSLIAAEKMGLIPPDDMAERISQTLDVLEALPKWKGHFYNWYDTRNLLPLRPLFISSIDSGNLAACLLCCAQGVRTLFPRLSPSNHEISARLDALAYDMPFGMLYDSDAELFFIGLHPEKPLDRLSHYDLLASESRLLSFVAICTGAVPVKHWYRLGRGMTRTARGQTLVSYSGTMFEYMMPLLFLPPVKGTLLYHACLQALREQQRRRLNGVFGISESGYYAFDPNLYYQYKAFGIPSLALDPTRSQDVVAPYASLLSLPLDTRRVFRNLQRMKSLGLSGPLGMFEAADFHKQRIGQRHDFRIVRSHMSHHQGMILAALCNALYDGYIGRLFSDLPRAQAHALLLEEKPQQGRGVIRRPLKRASTEPAYDPLHSQRQAYPLSFPIDAHILHGGGTTVLIDAQGGGYISRDGIMLTRFREQCRIPSGMRLYLRDSQSGIHWFATDPLLGGSTEFQTAQAVFTRSRFHVHSTLRIFVNPLDGTVLHHLTLKNESSAERMLEVCSYLELALSSQREDSAHPAFQNLFIETSRIGKYGVMAVRRPRKAGQESLRLMHTLGTDSALNGCHVQTDRTLFIGRGNTILNPRALEMPISAMADVVGAVIEPCASLRAQFVLPVGGQVQFIFSTLLASPQDTPAALAERYALPESALKVYELARTQGLVTARYLGLDPALHNAISRLCGSLCYTGQPHQSVGLHPGALPLRELWGLSVSGDLPILLVICEDAQDLSLVRHLLKAHAFFRLSGLWIDLIIVSDQVAGYAHPLRDLLSDLMQSSHSRELIGKDGGLHLLERQSLSAEVFALLESSARLILRTSKGGIVDQLKTLLVSVKPQNPEDAKPSGVWQPSPPPAQTLLFDNGYGGFSPEQGDYVINLPPGKSTPAPWSNVLASPTFGSLASESGLVFTYADNSHKTRLTRWPNDSVSSYGEENFFLKDKSGRLLWSVTRWPLGQNLHCQVTHSPGMTLYESHGYGIGQKLTCFTDGELPLGVRVLQLKNDDVAERTLELFYTCVFALTNHPTEEQLTATYREGGVVYAQNPAASGVACIAMVNPQPSLTTTMSCGAFQGLSGLAPLALSSPGALPSDMGNVGVVSHTFLLKPGETMVFTLALGFASSQEALDQALGVLAQEGASQRLHRIKIYWEERLGALRVDLPDPALSLMLNRWLPYQVRAARLFARAGFYQAGGAYGFRDQLQDMLSLLYTDPQIVRGHLLLCAAHQFEEGDVQHWWHPPQYGVRTRITDDLLFLPFVTALYVQITGDSGILGEVVPYLHGEPLRENQREHLYEPEVSELAEPLLAHCLKAIDRVAFGSHGLPLMGGGDWNDGMNAVGGENGESVWLGMFYCEVLRRIMPCLDPETARTLAQRRHKVLQMIDQHAWDGSWYLRAWYDDGEPLGGCQSSECRIDALPQCWAVLCGVSRERSAIAMDHLWRLLYERDIGILKLFTPPFNGLEQPGYIAGYLPGIRENGGQYTHVVPWAVAALHQLGNDAQAWELALAALPVNHARTRQQAGRYRVEPYVMAADIYSHPQQRGRGGWTWYTGSASWMYYTILEQLLGFQKIGNSLRLRPCLPQGWDDLTLTYRYGSTTYHLHATLECPFPMADGEQLKEGRLMLVDDGRIHEATFPIRVAEPLG